MAFINLADPTEKLKQEIAELRAENRKLNADMHLQQVRAERSEAVIQEIDADCPECEDMAALQQEVTDAHCDLMEAKSLFVDELCGSKWPCKFAANGLNAELDAMRNMIQALICELEYKLAVAQHNYAYCQAIGSNETIEAEALALEEALDTIDDPRCAKYINKVLSTVCI